MAAPRKYKPLELSVYPSTEKSIYATDNKIAYRFKLCRGWNNKSIKNFTYKSDPEFTIYFANTDIEGHEYSGLQNEQLILAVIDRIKNNKSFNEFNIKQIEALNMYLEYRKLEIDDNINKNIKIN